MIRSNDYYMLVASLPAMPRSFEVERVPINRIRLEDRLGMLELEDARVVGQVQDFLLWDRQPRDRTDDEVIVRYDRLMREIDNPLVRHVVSFRMDVRTIVSAIRRRRLSLPPPSGVGQWVNRIAKNWSRPDFNLGHVNPWVIELDRLLGGDPLEDERRLLDVTWTHWSRLADRYHFSFEAVVLYLARWEIIDRWTRLDPAAGAQRFDGLVTEALGEHADIFGSADRD